MKCVLFAAIAAVVALGAVAEEAAAQPKKRRMTPALIQKARIEKAGGLVTIPARDPGVCFANSQKRVGVEVMENITRQMTDLLHISVFVKEEKYSDVTALTAAKPLSAHGAIIAVAEMPGLPALLVAPDADWAVINMSALAGDNPTKEQLEARLVKEMWKAFGQVLGSGWSMTQGCIMKRTPSNASLDALFGKTIGPEALRNIYGNTASMKFSKGGRCTYEQACQQGWAAAPTNDIQKAVWERVHAIPDKPLKIEK